MLPVKQEAEWMIKHNLPNTPNFELVGSKAYPENNGYQIFYVYDRNGIKTFETRLFVIYTDRLYEAKVSMPSSLTNQHKKELSYMQTFVVGPGFDRYEVEMREIEGRT